MAATAWLTIASPAQASAPTAVTADGQATAAQLTAADARWQLVFTTAGKSRPMPAAELVRWGQFAEPARGPVIVLADGGLLAAEVTGIDKDRLAAESDLFGAVKIPLESLAGVLFHPPAGQQGRDRLLDRIARDAGRSDRLILDNGDEITGLIEGLDNDTVHVAAELGRLDVATRRIVALVFNPALKQPAGAAGFRAWAGLSDGSRLLATKIIMSGDALELTAAGQTWKTPAKELVALQPLGGRAVYLSDLKPREYRHLPYLDLPWPYHNDRNVTGGLLRCGGRLFLKGLGVHSAARLSYALDQPYRRFEADLGIDDSTGGRGSVLFRVLVDGRQRYASGPVRGGAAPLSVSIDLAGAKRLDLLVDYGEQGDVLDHADWLNARVIK
jgi:hypothetical protein